MRIPRLQPLAVRDKTIKFTGGLNEEAARLSLKPGELQVCVNYHEVSGPYSGYASVSGYERFDGQTAPSSIPATEADYTAREAARSAIEAVPGEDIALGVSMFNDIVLGFRNAVGSATAEMWLSSASGWTQTGIGGTANDFNPDGSFRTVEYKFADYNNGDKTLIIVDGVSQPRTWDGTTLTKMTHANLPATVYPFLCGTYNNRLFLAYAKGYLFFSAIDDPTNFDDITATGGYLQLGDEITNIIEAPGNVLVIICKNKITILKGNDYDSELLQWVPQVEEFSKNNGGKLGSAQRFMGDIYYADEEGITNMASTDTYGDFNTSIVSNKVQNTFLSKKDEITASIVDRHFNQYRMYFLDGTVLYFTFHKGQLKGATKGLYPKPVYSAIVKEQNNGTVRKFFTSTNGYIYEMDSGTSFDGEEIITQLIFSYHHYGFTRQWKFFQQLTLELKTSSGTTLFVRPLYDYKEADMPQTTYVEQGISAPVGTWGEDWGTMVWGRESNNREVLYLYGYGTNMALEVKTSSAYQTSHVLQNMIVDFTVNSRKL